MAAGRAAEPHKGPAGAFTNKGSQQRPFLSRPNTPNAFQAPLADWQAIQMRGGEVTTAQNEVGGASAFLQQPEADPFISKENKQKKPHVLEYSFSVCRPLFGPCGVCIGEGIRDDGPGSP